MLKRELRCGSSEMQITLLHGRVLYRGNESSKKKKKKNTRKSNLHLKSTLVECVHSEIRHKDSYFYAKYCRISARRGGKRALGAIAHSMTLTIYHILLNKEHFCDICSDYFNTIYAEKSKSEISNLLKNWGFRFALLTLYFNI